MLTVVSGACAPDSGSDDAGRTDEGVIGGQDTADFREIGCLKTPNAPACCTATLMTVPDPNDLKKPLPIRDTVVTNAHCLNFPDGGCQQASCNVAATVTFDRADGSTLSVETDGYAVAGKWPSSYGEGRCAGGNDWVHCSTLGINDLALVHLSESLPADEFTPRVLPPNVPDGSQPISLVGFGGDSGKRNVKAFDHLIDLTDPGSQNLSIADCADFPELDPFGTPNVNFIALVRGDDGAAVIGETGELLEIAGGHTECTAGQTECQRGDYYVHTDLGPVAGVGSHPELTSIIKGFSRAPGHCSQLTDCTSCTLDDACGWIADYPNTGRCIEGNQTGPSDGSNHAGRWAWTAAACGCADGAASGTFEAWVCTPDGSSRDRCVGGSAETGIWQQERCVGGCKAHFQNDTVSAGDDTCIGGAVDESALPLCDATCGGTCCTGGAGSYCGSHGKCCGPNDTSPGCYG
jgi:hypothetical protein